MLKPIFRAYLGGLLVVLAVVSAIYMFKFELGENLDLAKLELFKFLLASGVVGGLLFSYQALLAARKKQDLDRQNLIDFRERFLKSYHTIKNVRRRFRFLVDLDGQHMTILNVKEFRETYDVLNGAYVEFELLRKISVSKIGLANSIADQVRDDMKLVDKYIRSIMIELEELDWTSGQPIAINEISKFNAFLFIEKNPIHVASSKSLDAFLVELSQSTTS